jgi:hypothetical protein
MDPRPPRTLPARHSVQQQNLRTRDEILRIAREFRRDSEQFPGARHALHAHSMDTNRGILVEWRDCPDQLGWLYCGCWLTRERQFFRFEVLLPRDRAEPPIIESWKEVTQDTPINAHVPGTGKSFGWLALDVLTALAS